MASRSPVDAPPGANIHRLRLVQKFSLRELARRCDPELDHATISRIERNEGYTQDSLERIAKALGVTVPELFLPPELADWPHLNDRAQSRIAESILDALTAQRYKPTA